MNAPYLLPNASDHAVDRFTALAALFDRATFDRFDALGVGPGWRCWEAGAGGPTVAAHLAHRVRPGGSVLATDIDLAWLAGQVPSDVDVLLHDLVADPVGAESFDLVHARLVLIHVPERDLALQKMIDALAPGGWLVVEDFDAELIPRACLEQLDDTHARANRIRAGFSALLTQRGVDLGFGRTLPRRFRAAGLVDVGASAQMPIALPATRQLEIANTAQVADALIAQGYASREDIDAHLTALARGLDIVVPPLITTWGRKPALPPHKGRVSP